MSNKSAGPVKTRQEKLIDKAQKAIDEFWPPESDSKASAETEKPSVEAEDNQTVKQSGSNPDSAINKKQKLSNQPENKARSIKKDNNTQKGKTKSKKV